MREWLEPLWLSRVEVETLSDGEFRVRVIDGDGESSHRVTLNAEHCNRLTRGKIEPQGVGEAVVSVFCSNARARNRSSGNSTCKRSRAISRNTNARSRTAWDRSRALSLKFAAADSLARASKRCATIISPQDAGAAGKRTAKSGSPTKGNPLAEISGIVTLGCPRGCSAAPLSILLH